MQARGRYPSSVFEPGVLGSVATLGAVVAGAAIVEAARGDFEPACRLYLGDFLEGFSPGNSPQFDEWAFFRREALRGRAIQALERVVHDKHAACDYEAAAAHAR